MSGSVGVRQEGAVARVSLSHPGRHNAMTRAMWLALRYAFESISGKPDLRCVLIEGCDGHFCAGGDISEYAAFRFQTDTLREFHEGEVWPALQAILQCPVPVLAQIQGHCLGAGLEIACCCDLRVAASDSRFGAPIAQLGFPMAPREAALVAREVGLATARRMLLAAQVLDAEAMQAGGFLTEVLEPARVAHAATRLAEHVAGLAPQAARLNKHLLGRLYPALDAVDGAQPASNFVADMLEHAYDYADSAEHREGIHAFMQKRKPVY